MLNDTLFQSIQERWTPEQVAKEIVASRFGSYTHSQGALLTKALPKHRYSSMATKFETAIAMAKQCAVAAKLFKVKEPTQEVGPVRAFIDSLRIKLGAVNGLDFKEDRISRKARKRKKLPKGHRAYNKRFRLLARLEKKFQTWGESRENLELAQVAKSRLAHLIPRVALNEIETACFLAWMTARLNVRSMFTFGKQERAFDQVAEMLLSRVPNRASSWAAISLIHPTPEIIGKLSENKKGRLLGEWFAVMRRSALILERVAKRDKPNLETLIVQHGNDSSTWNNAAGAYNKARDGWISTLYALGMDAALDSVAPGKAMRLMAADVAYGHRAYGNGLDPDTQVWGALPKPWEILNGVKKCNRDKIEKICAKVGTPHGGWIKPRNQKAVKFKPTPELIHGIICSDPNLATLLKKAGYFGGHGHKAKTTVAIERPFDGEKIGASWPEN